MYSTLSSIDTSKKNMDIKYNLKIKVHLLSLSRRTWEEMFMVVKMIQYIKNSNIKLKSKLSVNCFYRQNQRVPERQCGQRDLSKLIVASVTFCV